MNQYELDSLDMYAYFCGTQNNNHSISMKVQKEKTAYQVPSVEVITFSLNSIIAVSPGGGEDPGDENWAPCFPSNIPSIFNSL